MSKKLIYLMSFVLVLAVTGTASADPWYIPVPDPGFEEHVLWVYDDYVYLSSDNYTGAWESEYTGYGAWIAWDYWAPAESWPPYSGTSQLYTQEDAADKVYQILEETYIEGAEYTFEVWIAIPWSGYGNNYTISLTDENYQNDLAVSSGKLNPASKWLHKSVSYTATAANAGKKVGIKMYGDFYVTFDEVTLLYDGPGLMNQSPANGAVDVSVETKLTWIHGDSTFTQEEVYFGTDPNALPKVATISPPTLEYDPGDPNLIASTTYYWYIVGTDSSMIKWSSPVWSFTTVSGKAACDYPSDGALTPGAIYGSNIYTPLDFFAGATVVDFRGYCSENYDDVLNRVEDANLGPPPFPSMPNRYYAGLPGAGPYVETLERGKTYYWAVDSFDAKGNKFEGDVWSFSIQDVKAFDPSPADGAVFVPVGTLHTWRAGYGPPPGWPTGTSLEHDVYFGTDWDDVNDADANDTTGIYKTIRSEPNYSPSGLTPGTDYFWRIDEVWGRLPLPIGGGHIYKGDVWKFSTMPPRVGSIREDLWWNIAGGSVGDLYSDPRFPANPDEIRSLTSFSSGTDLGNTYGGMIHGWLHPAKSGDYTFWIAADDSCELFLSTDEQPANMVLIASAPGWVYQYEWEWYSSQKSIPVYLEYGKKYYIRACWKENTGGDHCEVAWQGPDQPIRPIYGLGDAVINGNRLEPFIQLWAHSPDPRNGEASVTSPVTLRWGEGDHADKHDIYLSTDKNLVDSRNIVAYRGQSDPNTSPPIALVTGEIYYWAIDEVNVAGPDPCQWQGRTWMFRAAGAAGGLRGDYYQHTGAGSPAGFETLMMSRIDPEINFNWGTDAIPPDPCNPTVLNDFSIRWAGHVEPLISGDWMFWTRTDDGVRLWIDDVLVIDDWTNHGATDNNSPRIPLVAGTLYDVRMEYYEDGGGASAQLSWDGPSTSRQIIPATNLWPPLFATNPKPINGSIIDDTKPALEWIPGLYATTHDVFFSSVFSDVNERKASARVTLPIPTDPCYPYPALKPPLDLDTEYYWLVDEYGTGGPWLARSVWSFKTAECVALDNMEDYSDRSDMRGVWTDGYANTVWQTSAPFGNLQGGSSGSNLNACSAMGSPLGGTAPIHGGDQGMALYYDNDGDNIPPIPGMEHFAYTSPYYSEIEANTVENLDVPEDWAGEGVKSMTIWHTGHPEADGSFSYVAENEPLGIYRYTLNGRGRDIGGRHDEFYFIGYYPFVNPVGGSWIQTRVIEMDNTNANAKAGLMMREKMTPYSRYAGVFVTPGNQVVFQWRAVENGPTASVAESGLSAPQEIKLERLGAGSFKAWFRRGGIWEDVNDPATGNPQSVSIVDMNDTTHAGMVVTSHNANAICSADFNNVSVSPLPPWGFLGNVGLNNPEQLYVALKDGKGTVSVVNNPDPNAALATTWQEWNIKLTEFSPSLDFNSIKKVYIGLGNRNTPAAGGSGILYVDDVRACPPRCVPAFGKPLADIAEPYDCEVGAEDVAVLVGDWLLADDVIMTALPSAANLIARYEFENNFNDTGPYGYHASAPIGSAPGFAAGAIGSWAVELDGVDDYLVVDSNVGIDSNEPRTISGWAKANVPAAQITGWTNVFGFSSEPAPPALGGRSFDIERRGGQDFYCIHVYGWEENILPMDQDWHHLAGTYDGTTIVWYGDGLRIGSTDRQLNTDDNVQIGKRGHDAGGYWPGLVDEFRIYNYALSDAEIAYLAVDGAAILHIPIVSPANLYNAEAPGSQWINFRDFSVIAGSWLEKVLWP